MFVKHFSCYPYSVGVGQPNPYYGGEVNLPHPRISSCIDGNKTKYGREVPLNVEI